MKEDKTNEEIEEEEIEEEEIEEEEIEEDDNKGGKTFTQEEVTKMLAREKRQGKKSILKTLGFNNIENAKKSLLDKAKDNDDDSKKESTNESDEIKKYAEKYAKAMVTNEVITSGVLKKYRQEVLDLVLAKIDIDGDDLDESVKDELENIKDKFKMFFEEEQSDEDSESESKAKLKGTGSNAKSSKKNKGKSSLAERLAKDASKRTSDKSSFFD